MDYQTFFGFFKRKILKFKILFLPLCRSLKSNILIFIYKWVNMKLISKKQAHQDINDKLWDYWLSRNEDDAERALKILISYGFKIDQIPNVTSLFVMGTPKNEIIIN